MAGRKGTTGFTRGGMPVTTDPSKVHAHPKQKKGGSPFRNFGPGEWAAVGVTGALTGLVGAATVSALREGFGGGSGFGKKTR